MPIDEPSTPDAEQVDATQPDDEATTDVAGGALDADPTGAEAIDDLVDADDEAFDDEPDPADFDDPVLADDADPADPDAAMIAHARKRFGTAGAIVAGGMLGLDKLLGNKVKPDEAPVQWEAPGEPLDIDRKGITVPIDDDAVVRSRPGPAAAPGATSRKVTRRRRP